MEETATVFDKQDSASLHLESPSLLHYRRHRCVLIGNRNISTKFADDWSNNKDIVNVFFKIQDGGSRHLGK